MRPEDRMRRVCLTLLELGEALGVRPVKPGARLRRRDPYSRLERKVREKVRTGARDVLRSRRERMQRDKRHKAKGTVKDPARKERERRRKKKRGEA